MIPAWICSAVLVTRGDVDLAPILADLPFEDVVVWANDLTHVPDIAGGYLVTWANEAGRNLKVYGRYEAIPAARGLLVYVQDDDCRVADPGALVNAHGAHVGWCWECPDPKPSPMTDYGRHIVCNMPAPFRAHYDDSALVGFGAVFARDLPQRMFARFFDWVRAHDPELHAELATDGSPAQQWFAGECDAVVTTLAERVLADVAYSDLPHATADDRMYRRPEHVGERTRMLKLARQVRDA